MVPSCLPLDQYWQISSRCPSSGMVTFDAGCPRVVTSSFSVAPTWMLASSSAVGSLRGGSGIYATAAGGFTAAEGYCAPVGRGTKAPGRGGASTLSAWIDE